MHSFMAIRNKRKQPSSPRIPSCLRIPIVPAEGPWQLPRGKSAAFAWKNAVKVHAERLAGLRNQLLAQRANDLRDVGERVLEVLTGIKRQALLHPANAVLIAEDLTPSDTAAMERGKVMGFATVRGGATSHVAILARSLGIPALAGLKRAPWISPMARP